MSSMTYQVFVIADASLPLERLEECRSLAAELAAAGGEAVGFAMLPKTRLRLAATTLSAAGGERFIEPVQPGRRSGPMGSAEFVWREDGRPDWGAMWTGFCELALYGGPPHRGEESRLQAPVSDTEVGDAAGGFDALGEMRRGIWETTGLYAEPGEPGWLAVFCHSTKMAAWLCATIILENVEVRFEGDRLLLPAGAGFALKDEVKSVITVLAKTNHYWQQHVESQRRAGATA
jgi:hypothetical protein